MRKKSIKTIILTVAMFCLAGISPLHANEDESGDRSFASLIKNHISISGKIEIEATWMEDFEGAEETKISLASSELENWVTEWDAETLVLEWDDEAGEILVDEMFISIGNRDKFPFFLQVGRYDLSFGAYEGNTISDPLSKEAFKTKEYAAMLGTDFNGLYANMYIFRGESNEGGETNTLKQFGGNVGYRIIKDSMRFTGGIDFISSIMDSHVLADAFPDSTESNYVQGLSTHVKFRLGGFGIFAEYISALESIEGKKPSAWQLESSYVFSIADKGAFVSLCYSQTNNLMSILPKNRFAATFGIEPIEDMRLTMEYVHDDDYMVYGGNTYSDFGSTGGDADSVTIQAAYRF